MNWYKLLTFAQSIRYFKVETTAGTTIVRAFKPEHISALYEGIINIEELSREEAASWDAKGGAIQYVFAKQNDINSLSPEKEELYYSKKTASAHG